MNLFDMLQQGQNGQAFSAMARQFGLSEDQVNSAVEAMMPAFSIGLKRNMAAAEGMAEFFRAMSSGAYARYFEDAAGAFSDVGMSDGNAILGRLFGSKEVSRAVAAQAEAAIGIGQDILKQMLPALATMVMGGLTKQSQDAAGSPFGALMEQFATGFTAGQEKGEGPLDRYEREQASANPMADMMDQFMASAASGENPFAKMMEQYAVGTDMQKAGLDVFDQLFQSGKQVSEEYQKNMESIFDTYLGGKSGR